MNAPVDGAGAGSSAEPDAELIGQGPAFDALLRKIDRVAQSDATVLLLGETGTGKEAVARRIHQRSRRSGQPMVVVDFATMHENLFQSELFGYEPGAFSGATRQKTGLFETATASTAFLDEIGEASPAVQAGLLRALDRRTFRRLGSTHEQGADVRVISATNRDLRRRVELGLFRQDLFYRLSTVVIELPPLRSRADELPLLVDYFVRRLNLGQPRPRRLTARALDALARWPWPGNLRELQHVLEGAMVLAEADEIEEADLALVPAGPSVAVPPLDALPAAPSAPAPACASLAEVERRHIAHALGLAQGNRALAAKLLGISDRSLYRRLHEWNSTPTEPVPE